ncbi:CHAT domain-containing protein [Nakamurella endophytica]|uniref:CHAT domain-containing protein n=1 Tax=Nakamurella endophytica TaxID=1748367 RepID=A0A917SRG2_9ACTN|nr:CHAT domain-containing protein [Nakamurella endophytica]GGL91248.1 CHAT domain-containing protein [Nakamurella endophytica]
MPTRRPDDVPAERAAGLLADIRQAANAGRLTAAVRIGERALRQLGDHPEVADVRVRIQVVLGTCHADTGRVDEAFRLFDDAERRRPGARDGVVDGARGLLEFRLGRSADALASFSRVIDGAPDADAVTRWAASVNRGLLHMQAGHLADAARDTQRAAELAEGFDDRGPALMSRHNLGYVQYLAGDIPRALADMELAQRAAPESYVGIPALDRARVLLAAGLQTEAREFLDLALADFTRNRARTELADALLVSAELRALTGDLAGGRREARRAGTVYRQVGNQVAALLADYSVLRLPSLLPPDAAGRPGGGAPAQSGSAPPTPGVHGRDPALTGRRGRDPSPAGLRGRDPAPADGPAAADLADRLLAAGFAEEAAHARLLAAEAALDRGDVPAAADRLAGADAAAARPTLALTLHRRLVRGRLAAARDDIHGALAQLRAGLDELADFQARFGSQDLQSGSAVHGRLLARTGLRLAVGTGSPARILQWLERSRAASTRLAAVTPPADPELAELLGALRQATNQAREAALGAGPDPDLDRRVAELRRRVRARSWIVAGSGAVRRPVTLAAVQRLLAADPTDPTVVAYVTGEGAVFALTVTARRADFRRLGPWPGDPQRHRRLVADLDMLAAGRVPPPIRRVARASAAAELRRLDLELVQPLRDRFTGGPLLVAAVGELATLPWTLLPSLAGCPVSVSSSVTAAMAGAGRPARAHLRGVLSVAGPEVPHGVEEAERVAQLHAGAGLLAGDAATGEAVLAQVPVGGVLHVAAHGRHEPESPLFSSVLLADGPLYAYDIAPNPSLPDQVVLSCCDVGRSAFRPGGEPLGLAAALLRSGVSTVVTAVSRVSDGVAAAVMAEYHARLLDGAGPAAALAQAVAAVGDPADPDGVAAPFSLFGAGS